MDRKISCAENVLLFFFQMFVQNNAFKTTVWRRIARSNKKIPIEWLTFVCTSVESRELECLHSWWRPLLCLSHPSTDTNITRYELNMEQCWGLWVLGVRMKKKSPDKLTVCFFYFIGWMQGQYSNDELKKMLYFCTSLLKRKRINCMAILIWIIFIEYISNFTLKWRYVLIDWLCLLRQFSIFCSLTDTKSTIHH